MVNHHKAPPRLVLATSNPHKLDELRRALPDWEIGLVTAADPPPEDGLTYEDNARIKARFGRAHAPSDAWAVGEDSGLESRALDGAPGVHTARWAAGDPVGRLLESLRGEEDRRARYVCVIVAVAPDGREVVAEGTLEGTIARVAAGTEGFGFDPVFVPAGETHAIAELGNAWKQRNSHRARAAAELARQLGEAVDTSREAMDRPPDLRSLFDIAYEEARRLGFDGQLEVDVAAASLRFEGLDPMVIPAPVMERLEGKSVAQQRAIVAGVVSRFLRSHAAPLDDRYDGLRDREVRARLERNLFHIRTRPERPRPWNAVGRVERALGVDGWQERFAQAAKLYVVQAARGEAEGRSEAGAYLDAANMYRLAGLVDESRQAAESALGRLDGVPPPHEAQYRCGALALAGCRTELGACAADAGRRVLDTRWWRFGVAAAAAERGDREELERELRAVERRAADEELDLDATNLGDRDMAELLADWLRDLDSDR